MIKQYLDETNIKYRLNLKFAKLEALELGLWAKTFQVAGHNKDQQPPKEQQSEPPKPKRMIPTSEPQVTERWVKTYQMTSMATQWSHSTHVVLPIAGQHMQQVGQFQHGTGWASIQRHAPHGWISMGGSHNLPAVAPLDINIVNALDNYSSRQVLMQTAMNLIQEFNGTNPEATIPWLDHI